MRLEYSPGTPKDLFGKKVRVLVAQMTYPDLVNFLLQYHSPEQAEEDLRDISTRICKKLLELWKPKSTTVVSLIKELLTLIWGGNIIAKIIQRDEQKRPLLVQFIDKDCKLCKSGEELLEAKGIHYCSAVSGFVEFLLNYMAQQGTMKLKYKSADVRTTSSKGSGDKQCIHFCTFTY
jgi:hypothetical protein